jgi:phenylalanyl-tRNA synthetase beta chain
MKVSYKVLKSHLPYLPDAQTCAKNLVMHTAEVEEVHSQKADFDHMVLGQITSVSKHPDADSLRVCMVSVGEEADIQIVCGGSNLEV